MYPILFSIGSFHLYSFSVFLIVAWCVFSFLFWKLLRSSAIPEERIFDLTFYTTIVSLITSRLVFVSLHFSLFEKNILRAVALWVQPGLSLYGALFGGVLTIVLLSRRYKVRVGHVLDSLALPLLGALMIGALGALLDGSEVGLVAKIPWAVRYVGHIGNRHPIGAYEIGIFALLTILLWFLQKRAQLRQWPYGLIGICFFLLFSLSMFGIEFFKDTTVLWKSLGANQWILLIFIAESLGALYVRGGGRALARTIARKIINLLIKRRSS